MKTYGTREDVYNGFAKKTRGGLTKNDIILKWGKFISRRISERMKKGLGMYNVKSYLLKNKYTLQLIFFNRLRMFRFFFKNIRT